MFLLNRRYRFEEGSRRVARGGRIDEVPQISVDFEDVTVTMTVLDFDDERSASRVHASDEPSRARLADVEALLSR
jgi:hypothetical protein